jgi:hypothetical protein
MRNLRRLPTINGPAKNDRHVIRETSVRQPNETYEPNRGSVEVLPPRDLTNALRARVLEEPVRGDEQRSLRRGGDERDWNRRARPQTRLAELPAREIMISARGDPPGR